MNTAISAEPTAGGSSSRDGYTPESGPAGSRAIGRREVAGLLVACMLGVSMVATVWPAVPAWLPATAAWGAFSLLWPGLGAQQRIQTLVFFALGLVALWWGREHGATVQIESVLGRNQLILSMLASVSLLRLLSPSDTKADGQLPRGIGAYVRSMLGVHGFASVINISALILMADRLAHMASLRMQQALLLSRAFSAVAFYSPFIGGVALALAYTPGSNPLGLVLSGLPLAMAGLLLLYWYARSGRVDDLESFRGYPIHFESLRLPVVLALTVMGGVLVIDEISVLSLITVLTPLVVCGALVARGGLAGLRHAMTVYVMRRLPEMGGELALLLAAGVLASGLVAAVAGLDGWTPVTEFGALQASGLLLIFIVLSLICIHPVVIVSVLAPLLISIESDPTLVAIAFAMGWGLGCAVNPMSGTNLILNTRYGVSNWAVAYSNVGFSGTLYIVAVVLLYLYELMTV